MLHFITKSLLLAGLVLPVACGKPAPAEEEATRPETLAVETDSDSAVTAEVKPEIHIAPTQADVADLPRRFLVETEVISADIRIPDEVFITAPALARRLVEEAEAALEAGKQTARASQTADLSAFKPHVLRVTWQVTGAAKPLISVEKFVYEYAGAAHPSIITHGLIHNTETGKDLSFRDMLINSEGAINAHMDTILDALLAQKLANGGAADAAEMIRGELSDVVSADMILSSAVSLIDSTTPGKFGGYAVHFAPYEIGSFAEGAYHVTIPQSDFKLHLRPEYAALFDGAPVSVERPDAK